MCFLLHFFGFLVIIFLHICMLKINFLADIHCWRPLPWFLTNNLFALLKTRIWLKLNLKINNLFDASSDLIFVGRRSIVLTRTAVNSQYWDLTSGRFYFVWKIRTQGSQSIQLVGNFLPNELFQSFKGTGSREKYSVLSHEVLVGWLVGWLVGCLIGWLVG